MKQFKNNKNNIVKGINKYDNYNIINEEVYYLERKNYYDNYYIRYNHYYLDENYNLKYIYTYFVYIKTTCNKN